MPDFSAFPLPLNIAIFAGAAVLVWIAGTRLAGYGDEIAERSGAGEALIGLLLLAGVTSLPEIATSVTAAGIGQAPLAVNNLLGSIAMQVAVLAVADAAIGRRALTSVVPDPVVMLQGALNVCLLCLVAIAALVGDVAFGGAGLWTWGLAAATLLALNKLVEANRREPWIANTGEDLAGEPVQNDQMQVSNARLGASTALAALVILAAGSTVALTGDVIARQSGLGASFMGYAFVAIATSLPEASTVFAALRRGLYTMAISDILGTNILNMLLLFVVDLVAPGGAVMSSAGPFAAVGALTGAFVTGLFLVGLAERRDRTVFGMGTDSAAVLAGYAGGLVILFTLRGAP